MSLMQTGLKGLLAAMVAGAAVPALALDAATDAQNVVINEGAIPGTPAIPVVADQLNGNYTELFSTTGPGTFNTLAYFNATGWTNNGTPQPSVMNAPEIVGGYQLYALFQSNGTFTGTNFTGTAGTIQLWADPLSNTSKTLPGTAIGGTLASIILGNNVDDLLLGSASLLTFGEGHSFPGGGANGDFELIFGDWSLTGPGNAYFVAPKPFYVILDVNGNFQAFDPTSATDILLPQSSANAFFATSVPEPASLALVGLGLLGLGMGRRRKDNVM